MACDYEFNIIGPSKEIPYDEWQRFNQQSQKRQKVNSNANPTPPTKKQNKPNSPTESPAVRLAKNPTGGVYLLKSGVHFKIGKANDFDKRIRQVKLQLPEKAIEIHRIYTDDPLGIEGYWHKRFKTKRLNGEWFALTEEDVAIFKARVKM